MRARVADGKSTMPCCVANEFVNPVGTMTSGTLVATGQSARLRSPLMVSWTVPSPPTTTSASYERAGKGGCASAMNGEKTRAMSPAWPGSSVTVTSKTMFARAISGRSA